MTQEIITSLRENGRWYIVPEGDWLDELKAGVRGYCACGHEIENSYFAVLVVDGEILQTVEVGSSCIMVLTGGYFYRTPYAGEWKVLTDEEMVALFWKGHCLKEYKGIPYCDERGGKFRPHFAISVYDFAMSQLAKTGLPRVTEKQYAALENLLKG